MKKISKKLLVALLVISMVFCFCACSKGKNDTDSKIDETEPRYETEKEENTATEAATEEELTVAAIPIQCGDNIDNDNFLMTFDSVELFPESEYSYETGKNSTISLYIEDGYEFVIVKGHFENKSTTAISDNSFTLSAIVNDTYTVDGTDVHMHFFRDKYHEIDAYTDRDYMLYVAIPEKLADEFETVTFTLGFNNDLSIPSSIQNTDGTITSETDNLYKLTNGIFSNEVSTDEENSEDTTKTISIGETIVTNNYDFTLTNVELAYEVLPSNISSTYTSYPADSGKVYIDIAADVKNTMQRDIRINELFTASVLYDDKYHYNGFTVIDKGSQFDWVGSYSAALPLETCKAHNLIECPIEIDTSEKSIVVTLLLDNTIYEYQFR